MTLSTRDRLISAAEHLFAERGIDAVSLREISRAAECKNVIAAQYHFDDRLGMVQAILDKHAIEVEARRNALLEEYEARDPDVRALAAVLVRPLAAKLGDRDGGPEFLQIYADILNRPRPLLDLHEPSLARWRKLAREFLERDAVEVHRRFTTIEFAAVELGRRARSGRRNDNRLFTSWLVDIVAALLAAPVSDETKRLLRARRR